MGRQPTGGVCQIQICNYCLRRKNSLAEPNGKVRLVAVVLVPSDQSVRLPVSKVACCNVTAPRLSFRNEEAAPFNLLNYEDARKRAKQIMEVTQRRYMPPWLPEHGYGDFADERRLSADEIGMIRQWVAEGAVEGQAADLPPLPKWTEGWELSQPDLIVTLPSAYALAPDGKDVYRNFVVAIPSRERRFVKAVDIHPGNYKVVHHV